MRVIDAAATRAALPFERLVPALAQAFAEGAEVPPRQVLAVHGGTVLVMPAWNLRWFGVKTVAIQPANAARGLPGLHASYVLHDAATGVPLALIDGDEITARRTAAASALAASKLARPDARVLLVLGRGRVGRLLPEAYRAALPSIDRVLVWHRSSGIDLEAAVRAADIVSCATLATEPLVRGEWLRPGSHLDLIGSFTPAMREADDACFAGAALWVDTDEALLKSGDLIGPLERGVFTPADVRGTLADLARGGAGRLSAAERTVFKSVGSALEDLAAAVLAYEAAVGA